MKLSVLLKDMDIPVERLRLDARNVRWLLSNLGFRNSRNPNYKQALDMLKALHQENLKKNV